MGIPPVGDDEFILRHIPGGTTFQAPGPRITSKNFELRPGETGVSVSRLRLTSPEKLMARIGNPAGGSRIAVTPVREVRAIGLDVVPDPLPDDPGHAEIRTGRGELSSQAIRNQLKGLFKFLPANPAGPITPPAGSG